jgi:hypothetical protein
MSYPSPFLGLASYSVADADRFFGRDEDERLIVSNLMANRLTVVYGPTGVGKSSVINAGVLRRIRRLAASDVEMLSERTIVPILYREWQVGDARSPLMRQVCEAVDLGWRDNEHSTLSELLATANKVSGATILVILDQFEEHFVYEAPGSEFDKELAEAITDESLAANFLLSLREDSLAALDRYRGSIPGLFESSLRLDRLTVDQATQATRQTIGWFNATYEPVRSVQVEDELVRNVVAAVKVGRLDSIDIKPPDGVPIAANHRIEAAYLQLVMARLWEDMVARGDHVLTHKAYQRLGGAGAIVQAHVEEAMNRLSFFSKILATKTLDYFLVASGAKIAFSAADIAGYLHSRRLRRKVSLILNRLASGEVRLLRPVAPYRANGPVRYEIYHDVLVHPLINWYNRHLWFVLFGAIIFGLGARVLTVVIGIAAAGAIAIRFLDWIASVLGSRSLPKEKA